MQFLPDRVLICFRNGNLRLLQVLAFELSLQVDGTAPMSLCFSGSGKLVLGVKKSAPSRLSILRE